MKTKVFIIGLVGGLVGAGLIIAVLALSGTSIVTNDSTQAAEGAPASFATPSGELTPEQIYEQSTPGVVEVQSTFPSIQGFFGQQGGGLGIGTGFVVSSAGEILTNAHVVVEYPQASGLSTPQLATKVEVVFKGMGASTTKIAAQIAGVDGSTDVALLKIDPSKVPDLKPLTLGDSSTVQVGQPVAAIGNPLGLQFTMTSGIVSAVDRRSTRRRAPSSRTVSRPMPPSTRATPGGH